MIARKRVDFKAVINRNGFVAAFFVSFCFAGQSC